MAIKGSLREASLPDVLQLLTLGKKTGCLSVTHRSLERLGLRETWATDNNHALPSVLAMGALILLASCVLVVIAEWVRQLGTSERKVGVA